MSNDISKEVEKLERIRKEAKEKMERLKQKAKKESELIDMEYPRQKRTLRKRKIPKVRRTFLIDKHSSYLLDEIYKSDWDYKDEKVSYGQILERCIAKEYKSIFKKGDDY